MEHSTTEISAAEPSSITKTKSIQLLTSSLAGNLTRKQKKLDQETLDRLMGYYHIIMSEAAESLIHMPHLLLLPIKLLGVVFVWAMPNLTYQSTMDLGNKRFATFLHSDGPIMNWKLVVSPQSQNLNVLLGSS